MERWLHWQQVVLVPVPVDCTLTLIYQLLELVWLGTGLEIELGTGGVENGPVNGTEGGLEIGFGVGL